MFDEVESRDRAISCDSCDENAYLTEEDHQYYLDLARYVQFEQDTLDGIGKEVHVLSGTSGAHVAAIAHLSLLYPCFSTTLLEEMRTGDFHGMSAKEIMEDYPLEYEKRMKDKLRYRYPGFGGESYLDVIERIRPVIIELERRRRSVVVICHLSVLRCIHSYFMGTPREKLPYQKFHKHRLYELTPGAS